MIENRVQIRFPVDSEEWHAASAEILWAEIVRRGTKKLFKLLNSPFYFRGVSRFDVVDVVPAPNGLGLDYSTTVEKSGHSNIWLQVVFPAPAAFEGPWSMLRDLGCVCESTLMNTENGKMTLYALDVPADADGHRVVSILDQPEAVWIFQIAHLAHKSS